MKLQKYLILLAFFSFTLLNSQEFYLNFDLPQAYHIDKTNHDPVGYVTKLKIGDLNLKNDQRVTDPTDETKELSVVGVLDSLVWDGDSTAPLNLSFSISPENSQNIQQLIMKGLTNTEVEFQLACYQFDEEKGSYLPVFSSRNDKLKGVIEKRYGNLNIAVGDELFGEKNLPQSYSLVIAILPKGKHTFSIKGKNGLKMRVWGQE